MSSLRGLKYFECPASTMHHGNWKSGLFQHSNELYKAMVKLNELFKFGYSEEDLLVCAFFHDLNKTVMYEHNYLKSGEQSVAKPYKIKDQWRGDGDLSCYLVTTSLGIPLSISQYNAIRWHNQYEESYPKNSVSKFEGYPLIWLLQTADMYASQILKI